MIKLIVFHKIDIMLVHIGNSLNVFGLGKLCGGLAVNIKICKLALALLVKSCVRDIHAFYRCGVGNICADAEALSFLYKQERTCCHENGDNICCNALQDMSEAPVAHHMEHKVNYGCDYKHGNYL